MNLNKDWIPNINKYNMILKEEKLKKEMKEIKILCR